MSLQGPQAHGHVRGQGLAKGLLDQGVQARRTARHHHRAEHWIVLSGTAKVRIGELTQLLAENQSIYIPIGETHSLENPGNIPLELIEVQSGSYLGEDDIVRTDDVYNRAAEETR